MKSLVIVESPAKAKIIAKYLNSFPDLVGKYGKFTVVASFGHVRDLKQKEFGIDIESGRFEPIYDIIPDKKKLVLELKKKINDHDMIFLASDSDLEGNAIAWHIKEMYRLKNYKRILFNEITKHALHHAVVNSGDIDMNSVNAQKARRVLDRIVGFKLSPLLWKFYKTGGIGLSAGRVQSAVLKIIIDKENEIENFETEAYWSFDGTFNYDIEDAKLCNKDGGIFHVETSDKVERLLQSISHRFTMTDCKVSQRVVKPDKPYITSTLQQEAYSKLGLSIKKTMKLAQDLYENGLITYMRTDSIMMSKDAIGMIETFVSANYGEPYLERNVSYKTKSKNAQEAHECIRPTDVSKMQDSIELSKEHQKLYDLIWKKAVASRMKAAIYNDLDIILVEPYLASKNLYFGGKIKKLEFEGFLRIYGLQPDNIDLKKKIEVLRNADGFICKNIFGRNTWKTPPARYNESSIIKLLDKEGIGRPATYSSILTKLYDKKYIEKANVSGTPRECVHYQWKPETKKMAKEKIMIQHGAETSKLQPTNTGKEINDFLSKYFAYIIDKHFTADMEENLDKISAGELSYLETMKAFWKEFDQHLKKVETQVVKSKDKTDLRQEKQIIKYNNSDYYVSTTRYGPAISFKDHNDKIIYKDLKNYLKITGKNQNDIDNADLSFILIIPYDYGNGYVLKSGPYGYYISQSGVNFPVPISILKKYKDNMSELLKLNLSTLEAFKNYKSTKSTKSKRTS
jgi:DNA topoisomerase I